MRAAARSAVVLVVLVATAFLGAPRAQALISSLKSTTQTVVKTTSTTVNTALQPVTQVTAPATETITETVVEPLATTAGSATSETTTAASETLNAFGVPDPYNAIPAGYDPFAPLAGLAGGTQGLPSATEQLACPVATETGELVALAGATLIADGLTTLACQASFLEYSFYTRGKARDGSEIAREHVATLGVPTLLDVDQDVEPDLIGMITLLGPNSIGLVVDYAMTEGGKPVAAVEAVLRDPTRGSLGRDRIAFGYDQLKDRAPKRFVLSTAIDSILRPSPEFMFSLSQGDAGATTTLIGSIFDGTPAQRTDPAEVRLAYGRSPRYGTITARVGEDSVGLGLTTGADLPAPATISGRIVEGADEQRFRARFTNLPDVLNVTASQAGGATRATMNASSRFARLEGSFERLVGGEIAQKAMLDLEDVPTGIDLTVSGDQGSVATTGGPIGHTLVAAANGEPVLLVGERAYLKLHDDGALRSVAAAVPGLRSATFTLGGAPEISAEIAPTPFLVRIAQPGRTLGADILNLPARFDIGLDVDAGRLSYDGHGSGIDRITLAGDGAQPWFGRATKLRGTIEGIPAQMTATLGFDGDGGTVDVTGGALGRVELLASNGPLDSVPGTGQGVVYRDLSGGDYLVSARLLGLRRIAFGGGAESISLETHTAGGPFSLAARTDDFTADGLIADLPAKANLTAALDQGRITFTGRDGADQPQGIDSLDLAVTSTGALFGRADHLKAHLGGIPADLTLDVAQGGAGADVTASDGIGLVEIVAANREPRADDLPAGGEQGAKFTDLTGGDFVIGARIRELRRLSGSFGTPVKLVADTAGGPFGLRLDTDDVSGLVRIEDLPAHLDATLDLAAGKLTAISRDGDGNPQRIGRIAVDLAGEQALFGRATNVVATIEGIPSDLVLDVAQDGRGARIEGNEPIDLIELVAANRAPQPDDLPLNGEQGAKLVDLEGGEYAVGARVRSLKRLAASFGDAMTLSAQTAGGPFGVRIVDDEVRGLARVEDLPPQLDLSLDPAAGKLTVAGRDAAGQPQGIERLRLDLASSAALFGRAKHLHGLIEGLPADVTLDLAQSGAGMSLTADNPIGLLEVAASDTEIADPQALLPPAGEQGAVYRDTDDAFVMGARVRELRRLSADLSGSLSVSALTAGGPFSVLLDAEGVQADARLLDLPADVALGLDPAAGTFSYRGKDASGAPRGVGLVTVDVSSDEPIFGRARRLSARIENLADAVDLSLSPDGASGPEVDVLASTPIGRLELLAGEGDLAALPAPLDAPETQGAVLRDRAGEPYVAALRVLDLKKAGLRFGDAMGVEAETRGGPFAVDVDTDALGIDASILDLPAKANLGLDLASGEITFDGFDAAGAPKGIDLLTIDGRLGQAVLGGADRVSARIEKLPASVAVGFSQENGRASIDATAPIQLIELFAWENGQPKPVLAADQGALLHDRDGMPFQLAARVRQLEQLSVDFGDAMQLTTKTAGGLFQADVVTDGLTAQATIDRLPTELSLGLDMASGQVTYAGSSPIDRIFASIDSAEPVFLGAEAFEVDLKQVPQSFTIGLGQDSDRIQLTADNPIGQIDVRARSANEAFPTVPAGEAGAIFKSTDSATALALRVFELERLDVTLDPMTLAADMQGGRRFLVDADVQQDGGEILRLDGVIDRLPSRVRLALEDHLVAGAPNGSQLVLDNSAPIGFVRLAVEGLELLPGADKVEAELTDIPHKLVVALPETGALARVEARNAANVLTPIGQIRLAASSGSKALPAYVSDATYNANPSNTGYRDRLEFSNSPASFGVALRLTGPKVIEVDLDPIAITLEQDGARTRPVAIDASIPNSVAGKPATTVTGLLNKPSARTVLGVTVVPGQPTRLSFENAAAVGSLSINAANLGTIPQANFSLANIPTRLAVCMDTSSQCRPTAANRIPAAHSNYSSFGGNPSQSATAGGNNRPYPAQVSMNFEDFGTSGTSNVASSMVTLNATVKLNASDPPITITNLRFHNLAMDLGQHPTSPTFSYLGQSVPRIYMFLDSIGQPFVMNEVKYPPSIESFRIGTDSAPASGTRRLVWLPGTRCTASVFGACITTGLDTRANGSLNCGGQRSLTIKVLGLNVNLLDFIGLQILPVCS